MVMQADIRPLRQYFLDFYYRTIEFHTFLPTRPWVLENLTPFDRVAYISHLEAHFPCIPEAFKLWILEWPARAVIGPVWPGLPSKCRPDRRWRNTKNLLCVADFPRPLPYYLDVFPAASYYSSDEESNRKEPETARVQNLLILEDDEEWTWMVGMDHNPFVKGKVILGNTDEHEIYFVDERPSPADATDTEYGTAFQDWVQWLAYLSEQDEIHDPHTYRPVIRFHPYMGSLDGPTIHISDLPQE